MQPFESHESHPSFFERKSFSSPNTRLFKLFNGRRRRRGKLKRRLLKNCTSYIPCNNIIINFNYISVNIWQEKRWKIIMKKNSLITFSSFHYHLILLFRKIVQVIRQQQTPFYFKLIRNFKYLECSFKAFPCFFTFSGPYPNGRQYFKGF